MNFSENFSPEMDRIQTLRYYHSQTKGFPTPTSSLAFRASNFLLPYPIAGFSGNITQQCF
jgi:hypothetical protein